MNCRSVLLAYALLAAAACASSAFSTGSTTGTKLYSRLYASHVQHEDSSSSSSSSSRSSSVSVSSASPARQLMADQQRKCSQYAAQVNTHNSNGYRLAVQKYRNAQQCPGICKMYDSSVPSGTFKVRCNLASCTCTGTPVKSGAQVRFGITDVGRFSFTALYSPQCTPAMSAQCAGLYEWCRNC